ncbi:MAG: ribosomal-protein-alanine N-acetyltransferase [Candidatus Acidulodesulfobacterium ferriphilum]|uniref:Ribosomal-protein-alanine N-acetyltransferase n=1 Tax=Candidatus Acidulodesulfobacterium ferriphilum TaxID=2597223 RepID=A0A519BAT8_9DELT|nr:MAG: ribosomal-protein-alanine N-acetyltransferase [Candidatus Acidulodesulfobacterium ferriphilum]
MLEDMQLNCVNLKDIINPAPPLSEGLDKNEEQNKAGLNRTAETTPDSQPILDYTIKEMFNIHMQASQTIWDKKMFDDEFKRQGSGFIVCYTNDEYKKSDKTVSKAFIHAGNTDDNINLSLKSKIIAFFIFYTVLDEMHILDITVAKNEQSKGIGTFMLNYILKKYIDLGIKYFYLEVRVSNARAINLYKKFGFKIFMLRKGYYDDNKEDALCMVKEAV